jgi:hypothetical protein
MRKIGERERMMILCDKETCGRRRVLKVETLQRLIDTRQKGRMDTNAPAASYPMRFVLYDTRLKLQIERKKERKKERKGRTGRNRTLAEEKKSQPARS